MLLGRCVIMKTYRYDRQAQATDVEYYIGDGRIMERMPDGIVITKETALVRISHKVQ